MRRRSIDRDHSVNRPPFGRADQMVVGDPDRVKRCFHLAPPMVEEIAEDRELRGHVILLADEELQQRRMVRHAVAEATDADEVAEIVGSELDLLDLALEDLAQCLARQLGDLAFERANAGFPRVALDQRAQAFMPPRARWARTGHWLPAR